MAFISTRSTRLLPPGCATCSPGPTSMNGALPMCQQRTLFPIDGVTSSPASAAGNTLSTSPAGRRTVRSGPAPALVSPSVALGNERARTTPGISGLLFAALSPSASLQQSLESRLRAALDVNGSPEYVLTWKEWDMPSGPPICALRARARRTSDKGCSGWPSPAARDGKGVPKVGFNDGNLPQVAMLAGWISPGASDGNGGKGPRKGVSPTGKLPDGSKAHMDLSAFTKLQLAGWATPMVNLGRNETSGRQPGSRHHAGQTLHDQVRGMPSTLCPAGTGNCGALNPAHSRWLMGFPIEWDACAAMVTPLFPRSRRSS